MRQQTIVLLGFALFLGCKKPSLSSENAGTDRIAGTRMASNSLTGADFMIALIPDTQYYVWGRTPGLHEGGIPEMFASQIDWIRNNRADSNIVFVAGVGDIVDSGGDEASWITAKNIWYKLDTPLAGQTAIPNGVTVGNHDQTPNGWAIKDGDRTKTTTLYNKYFGIAHFTNDINGNPRPYYHSKVEYGNDSHYDLITASGMDLILIFLEYNGVAGHDLVGLNNWCDDMLAQYPDRKAIIISHSIVNLSGGFSSDGGQALYDRIKARKNVMMMLSGHFCQANSDSPSDHGEGYNYSTFDGHTVRSMLSDYQHREWGGNGLMRLIKISPSNDRFSVITYSPYTNTYETDASSSFTRPLFFDSRTSRTCDFNNNGRTEWALFRPGGTWKRQDMSDVTWGTASSDIPLTADFDGDGETDVAVDKADGRWRIKNGDQTLTFSSFQAGDVPVPADFNGNGVVGQAYWRNSNHTWYIGGVGTSYGLQGDIPVPADYDGDGSADLAVFRPSNGKWYVKGIYDAGTQFGNPTTDPIPTPGDYDGDGKVDISVYNPVSGNWAVLGGVPSVTVVTPAAGDMPAPGDYDGDGMTNQAIFRPSNKTLYVYNNGTVTPTVISAYTSGDKLLNLPYHIRKFFPGF